MKKTGVGLVILGILAVIGFGFFRNKETVAHYKIEKISRGDIVSTVTATGTSNAVSTILIGTQVSGTIKQIYVDFNSPVKKNQLIAQIDPAVFEAQVEQARANLLSARANLEKAEAAMIDSRRVLKRNQELFSKNLIAKSELETSETNDSLAQAQIGVARAQIAQTGAALRLAETNLKYTRIISPVDGIVVSRNVDMGQTVAASFQTPTLFNIAQDLTKMQIDCNISEADIGKIKVSQPVEFTVDAYPDVIFKGSVYEVRNAPIIIQNVVTYDVVVKVDNPDLKLKPGMTANVSMIISNKKGVLRIPNAALRFVPSDGKKVFARDNSSNVWILDNQKPKRVPVSPGMSDGNFTELISGELKEGQEVIVENLTKTRARSSSGPRMF